MNIRKVGARTLSTLRKEKLEAAKLAKENAQEKVFCEYVRSVARSILPTFPKYKLTVGNVDEFIPSVHINAQIGKLDNSDSIWAPWNKLCKK